MLTKKPLCLTESMTFPILSKMIHNKKMITDIIKSCAEGKALDRTEKWQVFCNVCDKMLAEGRSTKANHTRWTTVF